MKKIILVVLTLIVNLSFGQMEKADNKILTEQFIAQFNQDNYNEIFSMFADNLKEALPIETTTEFLKNLKYQAGIIRYHEFVEYENGTYASYKVTFEHGIFYINISLDKNSNINGLLVKPFNEKIHTKYVIDNLTLKNGSVTMDQREIIFEKAKEFPNNTQLSIAIIKNGKVSYYGIKKEYDTISTIVNQESIFEIGSISKIFTSTILSNLVTEGKVKLNDSINDYLKPSLNNSSKIAFINLANHTSGLPALPSNLDLSTVNLANPYKEYEEAQLEDYLTKLLKLPNKGKYQYSNLGAAVLGYSLSKIENVTYDSLLQEKIFSRYDMQNSTSEINKIKGSLVKGLDSEGTEIPNWEFSAMAGAGGIYSNVEDLSHFALAQFDFSNKELCLTREITFDINENMAIGLGWHILKNKSDNILFWHNGGTGGYSSSMSIDVLKKNGIIILSNVSAFNSKMENIDKLCFDLLKTIEKE